MTDFSNLESVDLVCFLPQNPSRKLKKLPQFANLQTQGKLGDIPTLDKNALRESRGKFYL